MSNLLEKELNIKLKKLNSLVEKNKNLAKQGSEKWLEERKTIIGGSEMSIITGDNSFSTIAGLVSQKVGLTTFSGNIATRWGNLFEPITNTICNLIFNPELSIYETGSIQNIMVKNQKFSPDGLTVMKFRMSDKLVKYLITLLEYKAPFSSIPTISIPKHYLPQVKTGMCAIEEVEISLFINNMFRKCKYKDIKNGIVIDYSFHKNKGMSNIKSPISYGVIIFYLPNKNIKLFEDFYIDYLEKNYSNVNEELQELQELQDEEYDSIYSCSEDDSDYENEEEIYIETEYDDIIIRIFNRIQYFNNNDEFYDLIDLGEINKEFMNDFLELCIDKKIICKKYLKPSINKSNLINCNIINSNSSKYKSSNNGFYISEELSHIKNIDYKKSKFIKKFKYDKLINKFKEKCLLKDNIPIAILPWKLIKSYNIIEKKDKNYIKKYKNDIDNIINIISDINMSSNIEEVKNKFNNYFPDSDIIKNYELFEKENDIEYLKSILSL